MSDFVKVLGQLAAAAATPEILYTVPPSAQTTCSSLTVCNRTASPLTFRVSVRVTSAAANNRQYLYYDKSIAANDTFASILGMTLDALDQVVVYASDVGLSFNLFGVEAR